MQFHFYYFRSAFQSRKIEIVVVGKFFLLPPFTIKTPLRKLGEDVLMMKMVKYDPLFFKENIKV